MVFPTVASITNTWAVIVLVIAVLLAACGGLLLVRKFTKIAAFQKIIAIVLLVCAIFGAIFGGVHLHRNVFSNSADASHHVNATWRLDNDRTLKYLENVTGDKTTGGITQRASGVYNANVVVNGKTELVTIVLDAEDKNGSDGFNGSILMNGRLFQK